MNRKKRVWLAAGLLLGPAACHLPNRQTGESYTLQGDPWSAKAAESGGAGPGDAPSGPGAPAAPAAGRDGRSTTAGQTVLEQLEEARAKVKSLELENQQLRSDGASLAAVVEQLRQQNANLAQLADAGHQARAALDREIETLRQAGKESEARCRALADDLLSERIQRVRVERELILAKVKEAESRDGGP